VEPVCRSFHEVKALALPRLPKRATRKPHEDDTKTSTEILSSGKVLQTTSRGVPVALFLTICLNLRDSYFVKTKAYSYAFSYMYVQPPFGDADEQIYKYFVFFHLFSFTKKNILHQIFHITPLMIFFFAIFAQIFVFLRRNWNRHETDFIGLGCRNG
jgi:hypothetical protein